MIILDFLLSLFPEERVKELSRCTGEKPRNIIRKEKSIQVCSYLAEFTI
jgi:hypothetical protein